ncbi:hypothetical protein NPIL_583811 [Nephila pilipes]|uniref:Uncharacterized protein n=1 Tax=Nephila pilipes TaxID=299642 RepID=A0A8X6TBX5_NEPPI|nr:hypothetical protein NPIL_583811 [Nephila pilipes]
MCRKQFIFSPAGKRKKQKNLDCLQKNEPCVTWQTKKQKKTEKNKNGNIENSVLLNQHPLDLGILTFLSPTDPYETDRSERVGCTQSYQLVTYRRGAYIDRSSGGTDFTIPYVTLTSKGKNPLADRVLQNSSRLGHRPTCRRLPCSVKSSCDSKLPLTGRSRMVSFYDSQVELDWVGQNCIRDVDDIHSFD